MSVTGRLKTLAADGAAPWPRRMVDNVAHALTLLGRVPRVRRRPAWREPLKLAAWTLITATAIAAAMVFVDAPAIELARRAPQWVFAVADQVTDFGRSTWFLVPIGVALLGIAALATLPQSRGAGFVLLSIAIRLEFLFAAIAAPSLFVSIVKRLIGRARPFVDSHIDPFHYMPFVWRPDYAGMPSGHASTAFAAAVAIGTLWPRLRAPMWAYALMIAASRVALTAHYPSDVLAGAVVGIAGASLVRDWFAARRLGLAFGPDGVVRTLPGPSMACIKKVARRLLAP